MLRRRFVWLGLTGIAALAGGAATWGAFSADIARARARTQRGSSVFQSRYGAMEYAVAGEGPPAVVIHGTGGGFDQGLAIGAPLVAAGRQVIAPSRFGYLRSDIPSEPSPANQADAIADLLDRLGVERASAIGVSAGALTALAFAIRHPQRCNALVALVPASHVPNRPTPEPSALQQAIIEHGLQSDLLYWVGLKTAEPTMIGALLATDPALVRSAPASERARARRILEGILPVSDRARGLRNDGAQTWSPVRMPIETIAVPTLAISMEDDRFGTAAAARHVAQTVPGARLVIYPSGGHVWIGHDAEVFAEVNAFLPRN
jgi:pimeloyl-ACP methyl ester carboxylesterase